MEDEKPYKSEVQRILEEMRQANISIGNHRKYLDKVQSTENIILSQIENNKSKYSEMQAKYKDVTSKQNFIDGYDGGIVSAELYDLVKELNKTLQETYSWKSLQLELNLIMLRKMADIMGDTQALDIKRDALKEFREMSERQNKMSLDMQKEQNNLVKTIIQERYQLMEDKMNLFMAVVTDKVNEERKQMMELLKVFADNVKHPITPVAPIGRDDVARVEQQARQQMEQRMARMPKPKSEVEDATVHAHPPKQQKQGSTDDWDSLDNDEDILSPEEIDKKVEEEDW